MSALIWGGAAAACYLLKSSTHGSALIEMLGGAIICGIAALLFIRTKALSKSDREILAGVFHGREARLLQRLGVLARAQ